MVSKVQQANLISENIKKLRAGLDWNQSKLAQEANVSAAALSKIEKSTGRMPTIVLLRKLASALKVGVNDLTGEEMSDRSASEERNIEFYRKFGVLEELGDDDQKRLLDMAQRLKEITGND